jgi:hypothetical protein
MTLCTTASKIRPKLGKKYLQANNSARREAGRREASFFLSFFLSPFLPFSLSLSLPPSLPGAVQDFHGLSMLPRFWLTFLASEVAGNSHNIQASGSSRSSNPFLLVDTVEVSMCNIVGCLVQNMTVSLQILQILNL